MNQLQIGLIPKYSRYFTVKEGYTSNLYSYNGDASTPFSKLPAYRTAIHKLDKRIKNYEPIIIEVPGGSTINDVKQAYPEHFI